MLNALKQTVLGKRLEKAKSVIYQRYFQPNYPNIAAKRNIIPLNHVYWIYNDANLKQHQPIIIDCGTGYTADFSIALMSKYNAICYGVDPTKKHTPALNNITKKYPKNFIRLMYALSDINGTAIFYETAENESSSMLQDHINVKNDTITPYPVKTITLQTLFTELKLSTVDILKIDIEGMECKVLDNTPNNILLQANQIIVEFHHHTTDSITETDVQHTINKLTRLGYKKFTSDNINYLFYQI
ncbi:MAG: FkbM family methyltransferase [Patescibacteria group bacterium]|jgi:FkbM family methyltransferase